MKQYEIAENIIFSENDVKYNTPQKIRYNNSIFLISCRKYYDQTKVIWRCKNTRIKKINLKK